MFPIVQTRLMIPLKVVFQYRPIRLSSFQAVLQTPEMIVQLFHPVAADFALRLFRPRAAVANSLRVLLMAFRN